LLIETDVAAAVQSGHLRGYGGDVWFPQPAPRDHPWRTMAYKGQKGVGNAMVPHMSGTTLDAQARYAAGTKKILENYFSGKPQTPSDVIVENGNYATRYSALKHAKFPC
jgi:formate dehydrogenase